MMPKALVLLSGGIDSATAAALARQQGFDIYCLTCNYGQRQQVEIQAARNIANFLGAQRHLILNIDLRAIGGSALTDNIAVPKRYEHNSTIGNGTIPPTYVPARNTILLSCALAWGEVLGSGDIFVGVNAIDYSGYPDCRPEYIAAYEAMANLACKASIEGKIVYKIHTPLINMTKAQIIATGVALGMDYTLSSSCYDPSPTGLACGSCDACVLRKKGFAEANQPDPTRYANP